MRFDENACLLEKVTHKKEILPPEYTTDSFYFSRVTNKVPKPEKLATKLKICVRHTWQGLGGRGVAAGATLMDPVSLAVSRIKPSCTNTTTSQT